MVEAGRVQEKLGALIGRFGPYFARAEPLRQAGKYLRGLLSDLPRKNCWTWRNTPGTRLRTGCSGCWNAPRGTRSR